MSEETFATEAIVDAPATEAVATESVITDTTTAITEATTEAPAKTEEQIRAENIEKGKAGTDPEIQRKLDKLVWEKNEAKREADRIKAELDSFKNRPVELAPPNPENFKEGEFDPAYRHALIEYGKKSGESEIAARVRQEQEAVHTKQRYEATVGAFESRADKIRTELKDFDAVARAPEMVQLYNHPQMQPVVDALHESEVGPQLAYYFGKNPGEAYRLANMAWPSALRELGRLEAKIMTEAKPKKTSSAPPPISPVSTSSGNMSDGKSVEELFYGKSG